MYARFVCVWCVCERGSVYVGVCVLVSVCLSVCVRAPVWRTRRSFGGERCGSDYRTGSLLLLTAVYVIHLCVSP